jgi:chromosomal replication initiation ATPase DnaA
MNCTCPNCGGEINLSIFINRKIDKQTETPERESYILRFIAEIVCSNAYITLEDFRKKSRVRHLVKARHQYMWLAKKYTKDTQTHIGQFIRPDLDHTIVIHGINTMNDLIQAYPQEKIEMDYLSDLVEQSLLNLLSKAS